MRRGYGHPTSGSVVAESHTAVAPRLPAGQPSAGPAAADQAQVALDQAAPAASGPQASAPQAPAPRQFRPLPAPLFRRPLPPDSRPHFRPVPARYISAFSAPSASGFSARHRPGFRPVRSPILAPIVPDFLTGFSPVSCPDFRSGRRPSSAPCPRFTAPVSRPRGPHKFRPTRPTQSQFFQPPDSPFPPPLRPDRVSRHFAPTEARPRTLWEDGAGLCTYLYPIAPTVSIHFL